MSLNISEVWENLAAHKACPEGLAWSSGKDSDVMWASTDEVATPYLFWWAASNAGQAGWPAPEAVVAVLEQLADIACVHVGDRSLAWRNEIAACHQSEPNFSRWAIHMYLNFERKIARAKQPELVSAFRQEGMEAVRTLRPTL